jgi:hypothetical protein
VSSEGLVTAVANGSATITAISGTATFTVSVTVQQIPATIGLSPDSVLLSQVGDTARVTAIVADAGDSEIISPSIIWTGSDESTATVSDGLVTAVSGGLVTITATAGSVVGTVNVKVPYPQLVAYPDPLRNGRLGSFYSDTLRASGGDGAYAWAVETGMLPPGVTLSAGGVLSGVPTVGGTWDSTVRVVSGDGQATGGNLSITIETATPVLVAFIADQGWEPKGSADGPRAVLELIRDEGAALVLHQGDLDYLDDPALWIDQIDDVLGPTVPYLASPGNHDTGSGICDCNPWYGPDGYGAVLEQRAERLGISWTGIYGEASSILFSGIRILMVAPGTFGSDPNVYPQVYSDYIERELSASSEAWRICSWHRNQRDMQVGVKQDEVGWGVYEACREGGAIIATGHHHSYSRTHLLSDMSMQTIASTADTITVSPGETFAFVSGLGGQDFSSYEQTRTGAWWASIYTVTQGATYGALFGHFNERGIPGLARFYFKNIRGEIIDEFWVRSGLSP